MIREGQEWLLLAVLTVPTLACMGLVAFDRPRRFLARRTRAVLTWAGQPVVRIVLGLNLGWISITVALAHSWRDALISFGLWCATFAIIEAIAATRKP